MKQPSKRTLPNTWVLKPLGELVALDAEQIGPDDPDFAKLPFLGLENIESHTRQFVLAAESSETGRSACWRFGPQHVLYGKLRPYLNKVFLPDREGRCSLEILPLLPQNGYTRGFVAAVLQSPAVVSFATKHSTGGRMPRADIAKLLRLEVALPGEVAECNALGERLTKELAALLSMRRAAQRQLEAISALPAAVLREFFNFGEP